MAGGSDCDPLGVCMSTPVLGFSCRVARIEAEIGVHGEEDAETVRWRLDVIEPPDGDKGCVRLVGHMLVTLGDLWGQAIVLGELRVAPEETADEPLPRFLDRYARGFADELYATSRRALCANAVFLDVSFGIPEEPPSVDLAAIKPVAPSAG